jgi:sigma-B regulation protein RsbU (phosphoserine phosphatase)
MADTKAPVPAQSVTRRFGMRGTQILYGSVFFAAVVLGMGFHFKQWGAHQPSGLTTYLLFGGLTTLGFAALWKLLGSFRRHKDTSPARRIWTLLVSGGILTTVAGITARIGRIEAPGLELGLGFDLTTGIALTFPTVVKMGIISVSMAGFAVLLMHRLRELVLVKRSRSSERNWNGLVLLMVASSLMSLMQVPGAEQNEWQNIATIIVAVFMVVNAFRLSWIVFLTFREKLTMLGLCLLLGLFLLFSMGAASSGLDLIIPGGQEYLEHFFMPLAVFSQQAAVFGMIYCMTSFLSLLFHLPTSGDYEQRAGERATMHSLAALVGQVFDANRLYATIASAPVEAGSADASWLVMPDADSGSLQQHVVAAHKITPDQIEQFMDCTELVDDLSKDGNLLLIREAAADHRLQVRSADHLGSLLVVPLTARDEPIGALFAVKSVVNGFERDDIETISIFAAQASVAIDNARLIEQQVEKERLSRELAIAREVQRKLLPQQAPTLRGTSIAASSVPAQEVGGDYYDFIRLGDNRHGVIIGDVSGKGTSAAFYMAEMQGIFQSVSRLVSSPSDFLHHANLALAQSLDRNVFISAIYGILDLEAETFTIARAGHCPAAMVRLNGESRLIRTPGLGLGLDRGDLFRSSLVEERIALAPGDVFVLYTDGVVESRNVEGEEFGYDRLLRAVEEHRHEDADRIHASIIRDLRHFIGTGEYDDDMTLLVLKWHGLPLEVLTGQEHMLKEST